MPDATLKSGICPHCGSREVFTNAGNRRMRNRYSILLISMLRWAYLDDYVCVKCGFVERSVRNPEDLGRIAEKWQPVRGR